MDEELYEIDDKIDYSTFKGNNEEYRLKIVMVGDELTGKSMIIQRLINNIFDPLYLSTVGFEFYNDINYKINNRIIKYNIWDCSGNVIYRSLLTNFYKTSSAFICVYSIDK